jgi:phosphate starvation-inducible PhoH-like protein
MVITGDVTQIDLPPGKQSGLVHAMSVLKNVEGISFIHFDDVDVVRHNLVQRIVRAYERWNNAVGATRQFNLKLGSESPEPEALEPPRA